jgi:phosphoribosyl-ATP pyrophosphohydrolase
MTLEELYAIVQERRSADPAVSYVARAFSKGRAKIAQKVGEEAVETAIAGVSGAKEEIVLESADLLFHLLILWADAEIAPADVLAALENRRGISGIEEKANRPESD